MAKGKLTSRPTEDKALANCKGYVSFDWNKESNREQELTDFEIIDGYRISYRNLSGKLVLLQVYPMVRRR